MATASSSGDWDRLSRRLANYMYRCRVDGFLLQDSPLERDRAIAELSMNQRTTTLNPQASIDAEGGNVDQYLRKVDKAIGELDDKEKQHQDAFTVADRVLRWHCFFSATLICSQYECTLAQPGFDASGLGDVSIRALRLSQEMFKEYSPGNSSSPATHFSTRGSPDMLPSPPRTSPPMPPSPTWEEDVPMERSLTKLSTEAITALLEDPAELVRQRFLCLSEDEYEAGQWSVESIAHTRRGVEYVIVYDDTDGPIPMDEGSMRDLMEESVFTFPLRLRVLCAHLVFAFTFAFAFDFDFAHAHAFAHDLDLPFASAARARDLVYSIRVYSLIVLLALARSPDPSSLRARSSCGAS
ncbi:uncharacterized protein BXZ73DRAFT_101968 [Epithele typhae]|uniref:uncharacterized protein n=1 Tax=Epithele typhae TaxID=378194 RepID=UPI002008A7B8|nr:uncharacterized protein BXZ73DRAFT_101968 [Epithele typhae]KAH9929905.1 hypothetical protein BXZ73DRAFT_101968 [Epithele typhae]